MRKGRMDIAISLDNNYVMPSLALATSIFENNRQHDCRIYLLTDGLAENNVEKFNRLAANYGQQVIIKTIQKELYSNLPFYKRYTFATYNRFVIAELIEGPRVLYLDGDMIVRKDLAPLWEVDLEGYACGVVEDQRGDDIFLHNRNEISTPYFNAGMLLINLDYWRAHHVGQTMIQYLQNHVDTCIYPDQDAANKVLSGKVLYLDYQYNFQEDWFQPQQEWQIHFSKWDAIIEARKDPAIVHYCRGLKPWFKECIHPLKADFIKYATMHDFTGYREKKYYSFPYTVVSYLLYRGKQLQEFIGR